MSSLTINPKWNSEINQVENGEPITGGAPPVMQILLPVNWAKIFFI